MPLPRPSLVKSLATVTFASGLGMALVSGCNSEPARPGEGPVGSTRAALTLSTPGFVETTALSGFNQPTVVRFASDGRVFVAEKGGKIWVFDDLNDATPTLFADLSKNVHDFWDRGLLGLALDPAFPSKPYVYVLYAYDGDPGGAAPKWGDQCPNPPGATGDGCVISGRLSRFAASGNVAGPETVLVEGWRQQYPSHSIGTVEFGPDGALYASGGDGASFNFVDYGQHGTPLNPLGDPPVALGQAQKAPSAEGGALRSQSMRRTDGPAVLNGSVIRVDPATGLGLSDNPLGASADANAARIVAYGLRNPFRIAARPGKSEMWIGDVGWNDWEEVNRLPLGGKQPLNFGWPCYEGAGKQAGYDAADLTLCESLYGGAGQNAPYFTYNHQAGVSLDDQCDRGSSSVTGIAFYGGAKYPTEYQGALFFADYSRRCIYVMPADNGGDPAPALARSFHTNADGPVFLTTGPGGDLFYAALGSGTIQRISYLQPAAAFTASPTTGQAPLLVSFDGTPSVKALPSDVLTYAWDLDGDGLFDDATEAQPAYLYDQIGDYPVRLQVKDQRGVTSTSKPVTISVTVEPPPVSTPPEVYIDTPVEGSTWKVGDKIKFTGHAVDAEDGPLPASALSWQVVIQHCPSGCHVHDLLSFDGVDSGSFNAEDHEYPMHLELILTAKDSSGQTSTVRRTLEPKTVSLVFDTNPSGLALVVGATQQTTPFARRVIVGSTNTVSAPTPQTVAGGTWNFASWSDGKPATHDLAKAVKAARYVASFGPSGGLTAQYFDQPLFGGTPLTRIDPVVDFNWGAGSPDPSIGPDTFSAQWTGEILADFDETYDFSTLSDDGVRLTLDGGVVIDHFTDHSPTTDHGQLALSAGWHSILLEYYENGGGAQLTLSWSSPSQPLQVVPQSHLRPGCAGGAGGTCPDSLGCNNSQECTPKCDPTTCKGAKHCELDGGCVGLCQGVTCPVGDVCRSGACVDACSLVTCGATAHCELGKCIDNPPVGSGGAGGDGGAGGEPNAGTGGIVNLGGNAGTGGTGGTLGSGGTGAAGLGGTGNAGEAAGGAENAGGGPSSNGGATASGGEPVASGGEPVASGGEPAASGGEPATGGGEPAASGGEPATGGLAGATAGGGDATGGSGQDGNCSCTVVGSGSGTGSALSGVFGLLVFGLARRRRRAR